MAKKAKQRLPKGRGRRTDKLVLATLLCAFPVGLFLMWSERCRWSRSMKTGVSVCMAAVLITVLAPFTQPPSAPENGIRIVSIASALEEVKFGPQPEADFEGFEVYVPYDSIDYNIVAEPTPAPEVIYVYCNDGGRLYHTKDCRYTKRTTPKVSLNQALNAGYKRCQDCDSPEEPEP